MSQKQCHRLRTLQRERDYAKGYVHMAGTQAVSNPFHPAVYLAAERAAQN